MNIAENFEALLSALVKHKVEFMLTGGYAVNFHGYTRSTSDLDLWVKPVELNKEKIINALISAGYDPKCKELIGGLNFSEPFTFSIGADPIDVDIFNFITGVKYEDADNNKIMFNYSDKLQVHYISIRDLIVNKMLTGRLKDKMDVEYLQKIEQLRKKR